MQLLKMGVLCENVTDSDVLLEVEWIKMKILGKE